MGKLFKSQKASLLKCNDGRADYKVWANSTIEYTKYPIKKKLQLCLWRGMGFAVNVTLILTALFQFCHPSWSFHLSSSEMLFKNLVNHPSKKCFAWTDLCSTLGVYQQCSKYGDVTSSRDTKSSFRIGSSLVLIWTLDLPSCALLRGNCILTVWEEKMAGGGVWLGKKGRELLMSTGTTVLPSYN